MLPGTTRGLQSQIGHAFHMAGLWEHIQRRHFHQLKDISTAQNVQVPRHGGRVTGDINDLTRARAPQQFETLSRAARARRIEQYSRRTRREAVQQSRQQRLGPASQKLTVAAVARGRIPSRGLNGQLVQFDARITLDEIGQLHAEEPDAAISIHEKARSAGAEKFPYGVDQLGQQKEIVLKKRVLRHFPTLRRHPQNHLDPALRRRMGPDVADLLVEGRFGNLAFLDVHHEAIVGADEADVQALLEFVPLTPNHDAVAIAVRLRAGNNRHDAFRGGKPTDALEQVANLFVLELKLRGIINVLVLATAAVAEIRTEWRHAVWRGSQNSQQARAGEAFLDLGDLDFHFFVHQDKWDKNDEIPDPRDSFATKADIINGHRAPFADGQLRVLFNDIAHSWN